METWLVVVAAGVALHLVSAPLVLAWIWYDTREQSAGAKAPARAAQPLLTDPARAANDLLRAAAVSRSLATCA